MYKNKLFKIILIVLSVVLMIPFVLFSFLFTDVSYDFILGGEDYLVKNFIVYIIFYIIISILTYYSIKNIFKNNKKIVKFICLIIIIYYINFIFTKSIDIGTFEITSFKSFLLFLQLVYVFMLPLLMIELFRKLFKNKIDVNNRNFILLVMCVIFSIVCNCVIFFAKSYLPTGGFYTTFFSNNVYVHIEMTCIFIYELMCTYFILPNNIDIKKKLKKEVKE